MLLKARTEGIACDTCTSEKGTDCFLCTTFPILVDGELTDQHKWLTNQKNDSPSLANATKGLPCPTKDASIRKLLDEGMSGWYVLRNGTGTD